MANIQFILIFYIFLPLENKLKHYNKAIYSNPFYNSDRLVYISTLKTPLQVLGNNPLVRILANLDTAFIKIIDIYRAILTKSDFYFLEIILI